MSRLVTHAAVRPFRISRSAVEAHQGHSTPYFGCPLCIRRSPVKGLDVRWTSPRHG